MARGDLSTKLIHLTRGVDDGGNKDSAVAKQRFASILRSGQLLAGDGFIKGKYECVCFTETPISMLVHALGSVRYAPLGVMVDKVWVFQKGGRPAIYQPESELSLLPPELRYRYVRYELENDIDFSWEREWRIHTEVLELDSDKTTVIVPTRIWIDAFSGESFKKWHFLVLDDLGLKGDAEFWDAYK